jgi:hypothetical protein
MALALSLESLEEISRRWDANKALKILGVPIRKEEENWN